MDKETLCQQIIDLALNHSKVEFSQFYDKINMYMNQSCIFNHSFLLSDVKPDISIEELKQSKCILVAQFNGLGDAILTSGFSRELRRNYPDAYIIFFCDYQVQTMYELCPYIDKIITIKFEKKDVLNLIIQLAEFMRDNIWGQYNIDLALLPHKGENNLIALLFAWLSGSKYICGYGENNWWYLYTDEENYHQESDLKGLIYDNCILDWHIRTPINMLHDVQARYFLLQTIGIKPEQTNLECWLSQDNIDKMKEKYSNIINRKIGIGIGGNFKAKHYPIDRYIKLMELINQNDNVTFFIIGGPKEQQSAKQIVDAISNSIDCTHGTIPDTQAILTLLDLYIGNDTGSLHMASTFGYPIIEIIQEAQNKSNYYPARFSLFHRYRPWTNNAIILRPLHSLNKCNDFNIPGGCIYDHPHCIKQIKVNDVFKVYQSVVKTMNADIMTNLELKTLVLESAVLN